MADTLHILVGDDFNMPCGGETQPPCNEGDLQEIITYIVEELQVEPRYDTNGEEHDIWYLLADILKALVLRIEALEE